MLGRGWVILRQPTTPPSLHLLITPPHARVCDAFLGDLTASVGNVRERAVRSEKTSSYTG